MTRSADPFVVLLDDGEVPLDERSVSDANKRWTNWDYDGGNDNLSNSGGNASSLTFGQRVSNGGYDADSEDSIATDQAVIANNEDTLTPQEYEVQSDLWANFIMGRMQAYNILKRQIRTGEFKLDDLFKGKDYLIARLIIQKDDVDFLKAFIDLHYISISFETIFRIANKHDSESIKDFVEAEMIKRSCQEMAANDIDAYM